MIRQVQIPERHGSVGEPAFPHGSLDQDHDDFMPRILVDEAEGGRPGFRRAFQGLHELTVLVRQHGRDARLFVAFAALLEHVPEP